MAYFAAARLGGASTGGGCRTSFSSSSEGNGGADEVPEFLAASLLPFEFVASADVLAYASLEDLSFVGLWSTATAAFTEMLGTSWPIALLSSNVIS